MKNTLLQNHVFQGAPGVSVEGQKGEPGDPGYSSAPLRSNYTNILELLQRFFCYQYILIFNFRPSVRTSHRAGRHDVPEQENDDKRK